MVEIKKVMETCYIVRVADMYYDLYIDLNEDGKYSCYFFDEYMEEQTINKVKNKVREYITNRK